MTLLAAGGRVGGLESGLDWKVIAGLVREGYADVAGRQSARKIAAKGASATRATKSKRRRR